MKKKSTILMAGLFLTSSLLTGQSLMASVEELADKSNSKLLVESISNLDDLFSADLFSKLSQLRIAIIIKIGRK